MTDKQLKHREKRKQLRELSKLAKLKTEMDCEGMSINEVLVQEFYTDEKNQEFKTFLQWQKEGYKVKKGSEAFLVWGRPRAIEKANEAKSQNTPEGEADDEDDFFPLCYLFSNNQVDKR